MPERSSDSHRPPILTCDFVWPRSNRSAAKRIRPVWSPAIVAAVIFAGMAAAGPAPTPADELLRYVPADVGFCFLARDIRATGEALADSPFVAGIRKTPFGAAIAHGDDVDRIIKAQEQLKTQIGINWETLRNDILGDAVAFAYRPGPPGKQDAEEGLILIRARAAKPLADFVNRLNDLQKNSGEVKEIEQRTHRGTAYFCRVERDKGPSYYCLLGPVLLLTGNEAMLRRALDCGRTLPADFEAPVARELRVLGADRAVLAVWLNPRAFDAHLAEHWQPKENAAAAASGLLSYWKALDSAACFLALDRDLAISFAFRGRPDQLPPGARRFLTELGKTSELWQSFPEPTLLVAAARVDLGALVDAVNELLPADGRPAMSQELNRTLGPPLGRDFVKEILPCVGPDVGLCVLPPKDGDKAWSPRAVAALKVSKGDPAAPVDQALASGLQSVAMLAVVAHNAKDPDHPLSLKSTRVNKREIKYLSGEGVFPPGVEPAFGLRDGYLVVATSPTLVSQFVATATPAASANETTPLLRINLKEWRAYLKKYEEPLTAVLAERDQLKPEVVRGQLAATSASLELFERVEMFVRPLAGQATLTVKLSTTLPLRK